MAKLVAIPTGTQRRRGSDGSGFAVGKQTASGTPIDRVNYESVAGTGEIGSGYAAGETIRVYLDTVIPTGASDPVKSDGDGTITITTSEDLTADATWVVTGRDAAGDVLTEDITIDVSTDADEASGTADFAGIYLITIEAPATLAPTTATWSAEATTQDNEVTDGMIPVLFPVSNLDMNEQANVEASDLISSVGAATPPVIGQYSGQCNFTTGLLVEESAYLFDGIFNNPTSSEEVEAQDADGGTAIDVVSGTDQAITLTIPDNSALTPAQADGTLHPSKLKIEFDTVAAGQTGSFTVTGFTKIGAKQNNRRRRTETITVDAADPAGTVYETENYYVYDATNALTVTSSFVTEPTPDARFTLDPELHEIVFTIAQNDVIFDGWSVQGLVGGEPRAGYDVVPSQITVNATPTGVSFEMQCPAGQVTRKRTIQGGEIEEPFLDANYKQAETLRYGGWAGAFKYADEIVKMTNLAIVFNRNYAADDAVDGDRFATDIEASDDRAVTVSPTTRFTSSYEKDASVNNWQDIFRDETRTALEARWYHYSRYGQRRQNIFDFPSALIVESPQTTVGGGASIDEALSLQAFATDAEREFTLTMFTTKEYSV